MILQGFLKIINFSRYVISFLYRFSLGGGLFPPVRPLLLHMDNYVKIQLPLEVHFIVSFIYFQVPLNLLKTDEFNQHIAKLSPSSSFSWAELALISTPTTPTPTHPGKVGKLEISSQ